MGINNMNMNNIRDGRLLINICFSFNIKIYIDLIYILASILSVHMFLSILLLNL